MIVEDQLDRSVRRIGGIDKPEELDELSTAVAISDEGVDLAGEQINPSQQAERAIHGRAQRWRGRRAKHAKPLGQSLIGHGGG
jgi:hypothetical protein